MVRGMRTADLKSLTIVSKTLSPGALDGFDSGEDVVIVGAGLAQKLGIRAWRLHHPDRAQGQCHALRHHAADQDLYAWPASSASA